MALSQIAGFKKFLPLIVAIIAGLIAVFLMNSYLEQKKEEEKRKMDEMQKNSVKVVFAVQNIPEGAVIKADMLTEEVVPKNAVQPYAAGSIDRVIDRIAKVGMAKGEQVQLSKVTTTFSDTSLSARIPKGKRALVIPVDNVSSIGGMLRAGDHVDIIGIVPLPKIVNGVRQGVATETSEVPLYQDILVLSVGQEQGGAQDPKKKSTPPGFITIALSPEEANIVSFVRENGKVRINLRSLQDTEKQVSTVTNWDTVLRTVAPQMYEVEPKDTKPKSKVEIYRGQQKEIKLIDK